MKHPNADLREWVRQRPRFVRSYTAGRIAESYDHIEAVLATCSGASTSAAYDVGCGAGFDSFALATHFDRVAAVDTGRAAIWEAQMIAIRRGVQHVHFQRADAESHSPGDGFDLVYCNIMSHNVRSRVRLTNVIAQVLKTGGWLAYAEATEGYAALEIHRAIVRRQPEQLAARVRQIISGFTGRATFRFFCSGTAQQLFALNGLDVRAHQAKRWNGLPVIDRISCQKVRATTASTRNAEDPDYGQLPASLAVVRSHFRELLAARGRGGFTPEQHARIRELASGAVNPYAPFLLYLSLADVVFLHGLAVDGSRFGRIIRRVGGGHAARVADADWETMADIDRSFIRLSRARAGLQEGPIEE